MTPAPTPPRAKAKSGSAPPILLIEDTLSLQMVYRATLINAGHKVIAAANAAEGFALFCEHSPAIVLLDLTLPDRDGLDLMQDMLARNANTCVIVITANGTINKAVEAMRAGAHEFLVKPFDEQRFLSCIDNALRLGSLRGEGAAQAAPRSATRQPTAPPEGAFIGQSQVMARVQAKIASVAQSMATVFITGESGTGKELCALAVHQQSPRSTGPFIALNCGAIPAELLESEVFGHVKGSFTGAVSDKIGAAAAADGGTLFLDEVCEMLPALQTKLLRFLQTSTVQPVGATRPRKVNVRIVCATNRDPAEAVRRGQFREDLYYRLYVVPIHMPPLRDRQDDVIEIAEAALLRFAQEEGRGFTALSPEVRSLFRDLPWPGNVRQVLNVMRNVVVLYDGPQVERHMLPEDIAAPTSLAQTSPPAHNAPGDNVSLDALLGLPLAEVERRIVEATIEMHGGSVPRAARVLDVSPSTLYRKLDLWAKLPKQP
ncbi:sigma-54-dependent Fis family transcriptional regulator [Pseudorhodobacter sp. E13]|uniref:sigma-54-dependent transcriptional regulator n=1 Tax=Pseudorhodobacter sp. E13 TaxID=2487931 RepID=UPI000F8E4818|nr:sigma-54 dependent transcriptional regulator [Pseudorhodobacter sp. E13]RUS58715.1 sigma-54-dependent Fis family transcriptional regulator [Pseudorhodobacter sp. E13]